MDIVDAQIHMGPGGIDRILGAMDALGIKAALVDEFWVLDPTGGPGHALSGGGSRLACPTAELAAAAHPDRFSWLLRIDRLDPKFEAVIGLVRDAPSGRAVRITPGMNPDELREFAEGGYDQILAAASENGLPVFAFAPDSPDAFARAARKFPDLKLIVDHCGLYTNSMRTSFANRAPLGEEEQLALFDRILALAEFPNVALKWGHSSGQFDTPAWPGEGLWPVLRRAISALGAERIMWASDFSVNQRGESWSELLYGVRGDPDLTDAEREAILGGTVRSWLDWPA